MSLSRRALALALCSMLALACAGPTQTPSAATPLAGTAQSSAPQTPISSALPSSVDLGSLPPAVSVVPYASGFGSLTFVTNAGDGSATMYALEQQGRIVIAQQGSTQGGQIFLDITDRVSSGGERGLLGLAFDPDFATNGRFYVDYTNLQGNTVVSQFTRGADGTVDPAGETIVLTVEQPFPNHNGGMLAFGPDGDLYVGLGDGGSEGDPQGNGQKLDTLLGKILRIDVSSGTAYSIPSGNPLASAQTSAGPAKPEIWDWGLRNPWRFSFDPKSNGLFIGDVGQDSYEEIDVEQPGSGGHNYGWNVMEGDHCYGASSCDQSGLVLPVVEYPHSLGCAVSGGYVYRGSAYPSLDGFYFYGDYCSGRIWAINADEALAGRPVTGTQVAQEHFSISSFGEDQAGELYVVDLAGAIYRLTA